MITSTAFKQGVAVLTAAFPHIMPEKENKDFVIKFWKAAFDKTCKDDGAFLEAVKEFVLGTPKLYPSDNWLAMLLEGMRPKARETLGDVIELIMSVLSSVSFAYPDPRTTEKLEWLRRASPISYAVGQRLGWQEMARCENVDVLRGQIRAVAEAEIARANEKGAVPLSAKDVGEPQKYEKLVAELGEKLKLDWRKKRCGL